MKRPSSLHVGALIVMLAHAHSSSCSTQSVSCTSTNRCVRPAWYNETWRTNSLDELLDVMVNCYDNRVRPTYPDNGPVHIQVDLFIQSVSKFSVINMEYSMTLYMRQRWLDPRLAYGDMFPEDFITLGQDMVSQIWTPDTYIVNKKQSMTNSGQGMSMFIRISRNGSVIFSAEKTLVIVCQMDLRNFPMDEQQCDFKIESYGFTMKDVVYKWLDDPKQKTIETAEGLDATEFSIVSLKPMENISVFNLGNFSSLTMRIYLDRRTTYYVIQIYIPCSMIVMLSWISFWLDYKSVPARTALGITTVLAMTTLLFGIQSSLPGVPYIKAVDQFLIVSFACVFVALIEFAVVNFISSYDESHDDVTLKKYSKYDMSEAFTVQFHNEAYCGEENGSHSNATASTTTPHQNAAANGDVNTGRPKRRKKEKHAPKCGSVHALTIDRYSRVAFPLGYTIYVIIYFVRQGALS
ncbi:glycine receptor subunit alpha-4 [Nematostella vectensis]|uniref:glycine receptor subunit alpha-4 n=1 Tax=Nematostella vectensis TaxID=45351 RepID=UPI0020772610|nr:glycine receptor subunit alpha-4 [Nematostella vectensis]